MVLLDTTEGRPVEERSNDIVIRLAESEAEIRAAQALRYRVFYQDTAAKPSAEAAALKRDFDVYDDYCDHLLMFDLSRGKGPEAVIGTYRLMRRAAAARCGQFYSADEYDLTKLLAHPGEILELGRSCIDPDYRKGWTMQLLWKGIVSYVMAYDVELMFGCASLPGIDPQDLALPLTFLHRHHLAPPEIRPKAIASRYTSMDLAPGEDITSRQALREMPPLIKGYLRLGGFVGDGAVVDYDFGTTDVCIVVRVASVTGKYYRHYVGDEEKRTEPAVAADSDRQVAAGGRDGA
jgi:putative hemolysin